MPFDFDLITVGAGSGGMAASRAAAARGARVAICEESHVGGTCVIRGCVPKKILVYGASFRYLFEDAVGYGWTFGEPHLDWARLQAQKGLEIGRLHQLHERLLREIGVHLIEGRARLIDPHTVEISGHRHTARHVLIATGGRPSLPPLKGIEHAITSNHALELPDLPQRLVIVGGGYIGVEFAGIFAALGARVTMLVRADGLLLGFDDDVRRAILVEMRKKGIDIRVERNVERIDKESDDVRVILEGGETIECDTLLFATGRVPNTDGLGLEEIGVGLDAKGAVVVDAYSRTAVASVWAVGDCTDRGNKTPVAVAEGRAFAETVFGERPMSIDHRNTPAAVFGQPPVGAVGLSESEARAAYGDIDVYLRHFRPLQHALSGRDDRTMIKLVVDRLTQRVLGGHMVGDGAPEVIQGLAIALQCGATKAQLDSTIGIHPTLAEEFLTMREKLPEPRG